MAAYPHSNQAGRGSALPVSARAKKSALGDLKEVMDGLASPKVAKKGESTVSVTRKVANSSVGSTDFKKTGKSGGTTKADTGTPKHKDYPAPKLPIEEESVAEDAYENGEEDELGEEKTADGGKTRTGPRANSGDLGDAKDVDKALASFMVKGKKHRQWAAKKVS